MTALGQMLDRFSPEASLVENQPHFARLITATEAGTAMAELIHFLFNYF
jgi:hypothetical protein